LTKQNRVARVIYTWMFSWAKPGFCETEEEFLVSFALLRRFVMSSFVEETLGETAAATIMSFLRDRVICHSERFLFHYRLRLFHMEAHTNCGLEGLQNGAKHCSIAVNPSCRMDKAVRILMGNSEVKTKNTCIRVCESATQKKLWSNSPTSKWLTPVAESMVREEWDIAENLECRCCETGVWFIKKKTRRVTCVEIC